LGIYIKTASFKGKKEVKSGLNRGSREQLFPGTDWEANDLGGTRPFIPTG